MGGGVLINKESILEAIPLTSVGLNKYLKIKSMLKSGVPIEDREFQRLFNSFYRVRARSKNWYDAFYGVFECAIREDWSFEKILNEIFLRTGRLEASFSSKIRASIDENTALIDSIVLGNLGLQLPKQTESDRLNKVVLVYKSLNEKMFEVLNSPIGLFAQREFFERYPTCGITPLKALDLIIWQIRVKKS